MSLKENISNQILAIIPAKGTSKGLPGKNLYPFCGIPLVCWSIGASVQSQYITRTVVSSDSPEILELAQQYGVEAIVRPDKLATDTASSESVIEHVLEHLAATEDYHPQTLILLQPTSPLRSSRDIDDAIRHYMDSDASALISGHEPTHNPLKDFLIAPNGLLRSILDDSHPFLPRQKLPTAFRPNGAIYIIRTELFLAANNLLTDNTVPFFMDSEKSIDIDDISDLIAAEEYMNKLLAKVD